MSHSESLPRRAAEKLPAAAQFAAPTNGRRASLPARVATASFLFAGGVASLLTAPVPAHSERAAATADEAAPDGVAVPIR